MQRLVLQAIGAVFMYAEVGTKGGGVICVNNRLVVASSSLVGWYEQCGAT
jgi:hypothetical protein